MKDPSLDKKKLRRYILQNTFDEEMQEMFYTYFFIRYQVDQLPHYYPDFWSSLEGYQKKAREFFEDNTRSIELIFDDELELVYFIRQPATRYLSVKEKIKFNDTVDRSSLRNK